MNQINFKISVPVVNDEKVFKKSLLIAKFNEILSNYNFKSLILNKLEIGILMIYTEGDFDQYDNWYKLKKIKYNELDRTFYYEIFLKNDNLTKFILATDQESLKILAQKILESLDNLKKLPKKTPNFEKEKFKDDLELFFYEQKLL